MKKRTDFRKILRDEIYKKDVNAAKLARMADINHNILYRYLNVTTTSITSGNLERLFDALSTLPNVREVEEE